MMDRHDDGLDEFTAVARIATTAHGANKAAAALLTVALWAGGNQKDAPAITAKDVVATYKRMLREVEAHDTERGL